MEIQEAMVKYDDVEIFFFHHEFKSGIEHAMKFMRDNNLTCKMKMYTKNHSNFGKTWIFYKSNYKKGE
jgi:hypothetical protein